MPVLNVPFRLIFYWDPQRWGVRDNNLPPQPTVPFLPSDRLSSRGATCTDCPVAPCCSRRHPGDGRVFEQPIIPPSPLGPFTDTYSTLSKNGAFTHAFSITSLGSITASIISLAPGPSQIVGFQLGVWNGTSCTTSSSRDGATTGSSSTLTASSAGILCVRLYDVGFVDDPVLYQLQVVYP